MKTLDDYIAVLGDHSEEILSYDRKTKILYWDSIANNICFNLVIDLDNKVIANSIRWFMVGRSGSVSISEIFGYLALSIQDKIIYNLDLF